MTKKTDMTLSAEAKYVLYGFCRSNPDEAMYLAKIPESSEDQVVTDNIRRAMIFNASNVESARKYINEEFRIIYGPHAYAFHPVKVNFQ